MALISDQEVADVVKAYQEHHTQRAAAEALGVTLGWVQRRLAKADLQRMVGDQPEIHGLDLTGITYYADKLTGELNPKWVKTNTTAQEKAELLAAWAEAMEDRIEPAKEVPAPTQHAAKHLLNVMPVGDMHLGMMAWAQETGDKDWDLNIGEDIYRKSIASAVSASPRSETLVLAYMGDFTHIDSYKPVTPASGHQLDCDTRFPKIVSATMNCLEYGVNLGLMHHPRVHVIFLPGNHDPATSVTLRGFLSRVYRNEPRVTVDTSPNNFQYFLHGQILLGFTHGDKVKMPQLPGIMATDRSEWWGLTKRRFWWTGHVHHDQAKDYPGCKAESVRVLPPLDSFASSHGYRGDRDIKVVTYHGKLGEVTRTTVNPEMFDGDAGS